MLLLYSDNFNFEPGQLTQVDLVSMDVQQRFFPSSSLLGWEELPSLYRALAQSVHCGQTVMPGRDAGVRSGVQGHPSLRRMRPCLKEKGAGRTGEMAQLPDRVKIGEHRPPPPPPS